MPTLFILSHAPHRDPLDAKTLEFVRPGDSILLIEDGVYAAGDTPTPLSPLLAGAQSAGATVYALQPDLQARGVKTTLPVVDYVGFVDLIEAHDRSVH
jgi:sulfur relay protein TusB/DsrH